MAENVSRTRDDLVARLRRAGELQVSGDNQAELDSYFDTRQFRFHGPDGFETDYAGLANYFKTIRAAFDDRDYERMPSVRELIEVRQGRRLAVFLELGVDEPSRYDVIEVA